MMLHVKVMLSRPKEICSVPQRSRQGLVVLFVILLIDIVLCL